MSLPPPIPAIPAIRGVPMQRFGTALGGIANAESEHAHFLKKGSRAVNQTLALQVFGGSAHTNIAIEFGFRGAGTTNSNSCASGTIAVGEALRYIRDDFADVMVAGGAEASRPEASRGRSPRRAVAVRPLPE